MSKAIDNQARGCLFCNFFKSCFRKFWSQRFQRLCVFLTGVLLDDLLVTEDVAGVETPSAPSQGSGGAVGLTGGTLRVKSGLSSDHPTGLLSEPSADSAVIMGNPVAPPINGETSMDISTENAVNYGNRYESENALLLRCIGF